MSGDPTTAVRMEWYCLKPVSIEAQPCTEFMVHLKYMYRYIT